ncbi:hypothetical protein GBF35_37645 [Nonomuraea phyllanthi]|uniref:hypothetical protein n=1 Tax=Nonomuraea phyllanthi TaxID=2219224 RepID=UPI001293C5B1|nr:hypothetical protein [Nonomuraea phyllanthi]QFY11543.1 hypothetical protein GBF35_37645 [Nonomuraea phyllanthi]
MTDLFGGAASYYARHHVGHGDLAIEHLAKTFGRDATVLDLGRGPGTVAIRPAPRWRRSRTRPGGRCSRSIPPAGGSTGWPPRS